MLTVEDYGQIRRAHHYGMIIRAMARAFHRSRCKMREALTHQQREGYTLATSTMSSTSTAALRGSSAAPTADRA